MRFKKGDKVVVRSYKDMYKEFGGKDGCFEYGDDLYPRGGGDYCFASEMDCFGGNTFVVDAVVGEGEYRLFSDDPTENAVLSDYTFTDEMLKSLPTKEMYSAFPANGEFMVEDVEGGISISFVQGGKTYPVGTVYATANGKNTTLTLSVDGILPSNGGNKKDKSPALRVTFLNGEARTGKLHEGRGVHDE